MLKSLVSLLVFVGFTATAQAQTAVKNQPAHPAPPPIGKPLPKKGMTPIDPKIQTCLEKHLGKPGEGAPPTKEKFEAALKSCNVPLPQ